jgi:hypothetical protein
MKSPKTFVFPLTATLNSRIVFLLFILELSIPTTIEDVFSLQETDFYCIQ